MNNKNSQSQVVIWLSCIILLVFLIIFVGGVTRLTHSGLSMVDWGPLVGILPPLSYEAWMVKFERYKLFPEYLLINNGMSLDDFKSIFFWEYFHRILGRLVGAVFFFPWLYFLISKKISKIFSIKIFGIFILGGLQGLMGWYMVKSGLVNDPYVSHLRLAAHLSLALVLICVTFWCILEIQNTTKAQSKKTIGKFQNLRNLTWAIFSLVSLQIVYGAFTAGLKAGFAYNTYPKMNGEWFPSAFFSFDPAWLSLFNGATAVQFIHRVLGLLCLIFVLYFWFACKKIEICKDLNVRLVALIFTVVSQFILGIFTLLYGVPVVLASAHQILASILLLCVLWVAHYFTASCRSN